MHRYAMHKCRTPPWIGAIAELARRQHGVVARAQLEALGRRARRDRRAGERGAGCTACIAACTPSAIRCSRATGSFMAAVLACGEGAALSHFSAAVLWGMLSTRAARSHVTAPSERRRPGLVVHQAALATASVAGIARHPRDHPGPHPHRPRRRAHAPQPRAGHRRGRVPAPRLHRAAPRRGPARQPGVLASVLAVHAAGSTRTRSELEEMFLALCDAAPPHRGPR